MNLRLLGVLLLVSCAYESPTPPPVAADDEPLAVPFRATIDPVTGKVDFTMGRPRAIIISNPTELPIDPDADDDTGMGGTPFTVELTTSAGSTGSGAAECDGEALSYCVDVTLDSFFPTMLIDAHVELDYITSLAHTARNSAPAPLGLSNAIGLWDYDNIAAYGEATRTWIFNMVTEEAFVVGGRVLAYNVNVAPFGTATQNITAHGGVASRAIDGNTSGNWNDSTTTHTPEGGFQPWWQLDLGEEYDITNMVLWNRTDCCHDRLDNAYVFVSDHPFTSNDPAVIAADPNTFEYFIGTAPTPGNPSLAIPVNRTGRYVRVQLQGSNALQISELQVYGY